MIATKLAFYHTRATEASQTLEYDVIMAQVAAFIGVRKSKIIVSPMAGRGHIVDAICQAGIGDKYS